MVRFGGVFSILRFRCVLRALEKFPAVPTTNESTKSGDRGF
jgi:hypothetical protein